jgi:hypothetical protein
MSCFCLNCLRTIETNKRFSGTAGVPPARGLAQLAEVGIDVPGSGRDARGPRKSLARFYLASDVFFQVCLEPAG